MKVSLIGLVLALLLNGCGGSCETETVVGIDSEGREITSYDHDECEGKE